MDEPKESIIDIKGLSTRFGSQIIHENLSLQVQRGEILAIVGGSGSGKTTLLREMVMLQSVFAGSIRIFGEEIVGMGLADKKRLQQRWGVMFQSGALFSGLTVLQNVCFPLCEFTHLSEADIDAIGLLKIKLANLPATSAHLFPAELSGGMIKRAAVARSIAMDPELLFVDEPTAGLDPESASDFDELVLQLRASLGLTVIIITHDMDTLWRVPDRVAFLGQKRVLAVQPIRELVKNPEPLIQAYFSTPRARAAVPVGDKS
ncbi:MAG: ATP-binding cassette domain-containing protein [Legionellales bacterium]|nr:ATP-binding cassette domain-containing protein [Legionellales bacterium]